MFIVQPIVSFADIICNELKSGTSSNANWHTFEFAVAWVNQAGARMVTEAVRDFLGRGGRVRATAGLDFGSTTYEGLEAFLSLEASGLDITTHVFCDENPACTFHPKVFLFSNGEFARLFVGSNNMTAGGLETNIEVTIGCFGALDHDAIRDARRILSSWRDESTESRSRRLTRPLLDKLYNRGYVSTELEIRNRRTDDKVGRRSAGEPLFGRSPATPRRSGYPATPRKVKRGEAAQSASTATLLMRVRARRNGNQLQISMKVLEASFMNGAAEVVSVGGTTRRIGFNRARGGRNTARFEAPEMTRVKNPVARFRWVNVGADQGAPRRVLQYEIFDAESDPEGARIFRKLEEGIGNPPVTDLAALSVDETVLSTSTRQKAQWYRLDSF